MSSKKLNTSIQLEKDLFNQIYKSMQGDVIQEIIKATRIPSKQNYWKDSLEGHSITNYNGIAFLNSNIFFV